MKNSFCIVTALICIHCSVSAYFLNEEKNKLGYISVDSGPHSKYAYQRNQRRQFAVHHFDNENVMDSHYKTKTMAYQVPSQKSKIEPQEVQITEAPKTRSINDKPELTDKQQDKVLVLQEKKEDKEQHIHQPPRTSMTEIRPPTRNYPPLSLSPHYETKQNFISMNTNKGVISSNPQKYRRLGHPLTMSYHRQDYPRVPTSSLVDKKFQQTIGGNTKLQIMSRVLDDLTRNITDRRRAEYRKREAENSDKIKNIINDTIRKYIVGKDKTLNSERKSIIAKEYARIGSREDVILDTDDNPYAIFYRMHPETLDDQVYISMKSTEASVKNKRLSMNYDNNLKKNKYNGNLKMQQFKKVKSFPNYQFSYN